MIALLLAALGAGLASMPAAAPRSAVIVCDDVRDPLTLDPHKEFSEKNHTLVQQIYEGLVRFDADGRIEPALAVSWERLDPLRVRFHLREGVKFHDGEPFTAEAVRFSIARYLDPKTGFPAVGFLSSLERAEIVDVRTVDIFTKFPDGLLLNRLAGFVLIVPPRYIEKNGERALQDSPNGTGPFRFERWERGKRIRLAANKDYWKEGEPGISDLEFRFIPLEQQASALLDGEVDLVTDLPGTETTRLVERGFQIEKKPSFYTYPPSFDLSKPPLSDVRVRRALNMAIDRAELVRFDALGNGLPLASLAMEGEPGYDPSLKPYPYDPVKAKALLAEAGYPNGFTLRALVKAQGERTFKIVAVMLKRVGVLVEGQTVPDAQMIEKIQSGRWDLTFGDCPDPMVHSFFIPAIILYPKSPFSLSRDEQFDRSLEAVVAALDPAEQEKAARALDRLVYDRALTLFTYQRIRTQGMAPGLRFKPSVTGMPHFNAIGWDRGEARAVR